MKTKVYIGTSLDGFIARKNGDIDWLTQFADKEAVEAYEEFIGSIDAIVIGRSTFEKALSFPVWPYKEKVFVLSTTITGTGMKAAGEFRVLSMKPGEIVEYLSRQGFSSIYIDGGKVIQSFLKENLIDELIIATVPVLIGSGIPLFDYLDSDLYFTHTRTAIASNGLVRSYYERKRNDSGPIPQDS